MSRYKRTTLRRIAAGLGCASILALVWIAFGCGNDNAKTNERFAVRSDGGNRSGSPSARPTDPGSDTATQPAELEGPSAPASEMATEVSYEAAETAYNEQRYAEAVELFTRYSDRESENPWGFYMLGLSAWKAGENERAETAFVKALELDPRHVKSFVNLSRVLLDTGRPRDAMEKIDAALAIDPQSNAAYRLKGRASALLGQTDEAIAAYRRAIQIDERDAWSMNNLSLIYIEGGRFDEALPPLARAVELVCDEPIFFNNLGMALEGTGRYRAAEDAYNSAVALDDTYSKAAANLTRIDGVVEEPGVEPVTLETLAQRFIEEVATWKEAVAVGGTPDPTGAPVDATTAGQTDSVVVRGAGSPGTPPEK